MAEIPGGPPSGWRALRTAATVFGLVLATAPLSVGDHSVPHTMDTDEATCNSLLGGPCKVWVRHDVFIQEQGDCDPLGCWVQQTCRATAEVGFDPLWQATFPCSNKPNAVVVEKCPADTNEQFNGKCLREWRTYNGRGIVVSNGECYIFQLRGDLVTPINSGAISASSRIRVCVSGGEPNFEILG